MQTPAQDWFGFHSSTHTLVIFTIAPFGLREVRKKKMSSFRIGAVSYNKSWLFCFTVFLAAVYNCQKNIVVKRSTRVVCSASSNRLLHTQFTTSALRRWPKPCSTSTSWPSLRPLLAGRPTAPQVQESSRPSCSASRWLVPAHQSASAGWRSSSCCQAWLGGKQLGASSSYCPSPPPQQTPGPDQSVCRGSMTEQTVCGWLLLSGQLCAPFFFSRCKNETLYSFWVNEVIKNFWALYFVLSYWNTRLH